MVLSYCRNRPVSRSAHPKPRKISAGIPRNQYRVPEIASLKLPTENSGRIPGTPYLENSGDGEFRGRHTYFSLASACAVPLDGSAFRAAWPRRNGTQKPINVPAAIIIGVSRTQQNKEIPFSIHLWTTLGTANSGFPLCIAAILAWRAGSQNVTLTAFDSGSTPSGLLTRMETSVPAAGRRGSFASETRSVASETKSAGNSLSSIRAAAPFTKFRPGTTISFVPADTGEGSISFVPGHLGFDNLSRRCSS